MQSEAWPSGNNYDSMINEGFTLEMQINSHRKNGSIKGIQTYSRISWFFSVFSIFIHGNILIWKICYENIDFMHTLNAKKFNVAKCWALISTFDKEIFSEAAGNLMAAPFKIIESIHNSRRQCSILKH